MARADRRFPTILLAEDNDETRRVYGLLLRHFGCSVEEAETGSEAVERASQISPDLILMDIGLPGMDGWQAARILKANPDTCRIPLVAFSALIDSVADLKADSDTFDGFISKPVSPRELLRRVGAYLDLAGRPLPEQSLAVRNRAVVV